MPPNGSYVPPPQYWQTQPVPVYKPAFNHSFHLILDAASCGFWIPVHLVYWLIRRG